MPARNLRRLLLPDTESLFTSEFFTGTHFAALATPELAAQTMLQAWVDFPFTPVLTIQAKPTALPLPDAPVIPADDDGGAE